VFDGEFELVDYRIVGEKHYKFQLKHPHTQQVFDAIAFNSVENPQYQQLSPQTKRAQIAYNLDINEFAGRTKLQLILQHFDT
ncbi:MAG: single-stranded-DNA-specific exonuclease RecJ, partial [Gammaproteobacteria bacterium]|nr:single-stranded-DNA-specific exonuclease RecJ [Gammaproteobacteria bacterium]